MRRSRKKYERPLRMWDKKRIEREKEILKNFGLRRKREIWKAEALLRKYRRMARKLAVKKDKKLEKALIEKLTKLGVLNKNANLDDVLSLIPENILERRLQTIVHRKGFVNTIKQARQFVAHGHVVIDKRKILHPGYLVPKAEEKKIQLNIPFQTKKVGK